MPNINILTALGISVLCLVAVVSDSLQPFGPAGSSVDGIFQARIWSGLPFPSPRYLPHLEIKPTSPVCPSLQMNSSPLSEIQSLCSDVGNVHDTLSRQKVGDSIFNMMSSL